MILALRDAFGTNGLFKAHSFNHLDAMTTKIKLKSVDAECRVALDDSYAVAKL